MREARGPAWTDWLVERSIPALSGIDTRSLVVHLRERGAMRAAVVIGDGSVDEALTAVARAAVDGGTCARGRGLAREPYVPAKRPIRVAVVDSGCKRSIVAGSSRPVPP